MSSAVSRCYIFKFSNNLIGQITNSDNDNLDKSPFSEKKKKKKSDIESDKENHL